MDFGLQPPLSLSADDRAQVEEVEQLARRGTASLERWWPAWTRPSWAVRRAVVAALARAGRRRRWRRCASCCAPARQRGAAGRGGGRAGGLDRRRGGGAGSRWRTTRTRPSSADVAQILGPPPQPPRRCRCWSTAHRPRRRQRGGGGHRGAGPHRRPRRGRRAAGRGAAAATSSASSRPSTCSGRCGDPRAVAAAGGAARRPATTPWRRRARWGAPASRPRCAPLAGPARTAGSDAMVRVAAVALAELHEAPRCSATATRARSTARCAAAVDAPRRWAAAGPAPSAAPTRPSRRRSARMLGWLGGDDGGRRPADSCSTASRRVARRGRRRRCERLGRRGRRRSCCRRCATATARGAACCCRWWAAAPRRCRTCLRASTTPTPTVRALACEALARIGDPAAVPRPLRAARRTPTRAWSQAAVGAIQSLGSPRPRRWRSRRRARRDAAVRRAALRILAYFGYPRGLDALLAGHRGDPDERVRDAAIPACPSSRIRAPSTRCWPPPRTTSERTRAAAMRALGQCRRRRARRPPRCCGGLERPRPLGALLRLPGAGELRRRGGRGRHRRAGSTTPPARCAWRRSRRWRTCHARAPSRRCARAAASTDADVRRAALVGLGIARRPEALPHAARRRRARSDAATRLVALSALAEFDDARGAARAAARAADDPDESVRSAAVGFLAARAGLRATRRWSSLLAHATLRERGPDARWPLPVEGGVAGAADRARGAPTTSRRRCSSRRWRACAAPTPSRARCRRCAAAQPARRAGPRPPRWPALGTRGGPRRAERWRHRRRGRRGAPRLPAGAGALSGRAMTAAAVPQVFAILAALIEERAGLHYGPRGPRAARRARCPARAPRPASSRCSTTTTSSATTRAAPRELDALVDTLVVARDLLLPRARAARGRWSTTLLVAPSVRGRPRGPGLVARPAPPARSRSPWPCCSPSAACSIRSSSWPATSATARWRARREGALQPALAARAARRASERPLAGAVGEPSARASACAGGAIDWRRINLIDEAAVAALGTLRRHPLPQRAHLLPATRPRARWSSASTARAGARRARCSSASRSRCCASAPRSLRGARRRRSSTAKAADDGAPRVRVLVVDDSAFARKVLREVLVARAGDRGGRHRARRPRGAGEDRRAHARTWSPSTW